jgi:hypothetical protein
MINKNRPPIQTPMYVNNLLSSIWSIWFNAVSDKLADVTLPVYANNAAALVGGLKAGDKYRTSTGVLMITY